MPLLEILGLAKKPNASATALRAALDDIDIEGLERRAEELEAARRDVLLDGDDAALEKIEVEIAGANRAVERSYAAKEKLEARLQAAESEEAEAARRDRYAEAKRLAKAAEKALADYEKHAKAIVDILETVAVAERAVHAANTNLPGDADKLRSPEHKVRGFPAEPMEIIGIKDLDGRWYYAGRDAAWGEVQDFHLKDIKDAGDGTGTFEIKGRTHHVVKRKRRQVDYLPSRGAMIPDPLASQINLLGLSPGSDTWAPFGPTAMHGAPGNGARDILGRIEALRNEWKRPPTDPRPHRFKRSRVEFMDAPAAPVAEDQAA